MLKTKEMPYCPGCGHKIANLNLDKAISELNYNDLDIIVVSDIGCCGLIDSLLNCHTIHGLHGRAVALAMGVALGLNDPTKKVIAVQGDGGSTIGLQHLLEAARKNVNMTLIVLNNMIYGMTGGQFSGLSPAVLKGDRIETEEGVTNFDIIQLAHSAGAAFSSRIVGGGKYDETLAQAMKVDGFSVVEIIGVCVPYGIGKMKDMETMGYEEITLINDRQAYMNRGSIKPSLFESTNQQFLNYNKNLLGAVRVVLAGSAGEGVQSAGDLLAKTSIALGLYSSKKGEYPITVGTGFSLVEIIISTDEILYTGITAPDVVIITSEDGRKSVVDKYHNLPLVVLDESLESISCKKEIRGDFRSKGGKKGAILSALSFWVNQSGLFPLAALTEIAGNQKHGEALVKSIGCVVLGD